MEKTKALKSIGISLSVLFAVGLLILGAEAFRDSVDAKKLQAQVYTPKYSYGQVVEIKLPEFYSTCGNRGVITSYYEGEYTVENVVCTTPGLIDPLREFHLDESQIIRVIEEENQ